MTQVMPPCASCIYFHADNYAGSFCDAFPSGSGIPVAILSGQHLHREPFPGDHGIQYAPVRGFRDLAEEDEEAGPEKDALSPVLE